jgi:hypothetical protein
MYLVSSNYSLNKKEGFSSGYYEDSLDVSVVQPIDRTRRYTAYCYGRIKTEDLSKNKLKEIFQKSNADIDIIEDDEYFILQYKNHKVLRISKKNGKFYSKHPKMNQEARIVWEILRKNGYIENPYRKYHYRKKQTIPFIETPIQEEGEN